MPVGLNQYNGPMKRGFWKTILLCIAVLVVSPGCNSQTIDRRLAVLEVPSDFALVLHIDGPAPAREPTRHHSQYIVEPNRNLRVALGPGVSPDYFPSLTGRLLPRQFKTVYQLIKANHLMSEPTSPGAQLRPERDAESVYYKVWITCLGRTHHFATTPSESVATWQLAKYLVHLHQSKTLVPKAAKEHKQANCQ